MQMIRSGACVAVVALMAACGGHGSSGVVDAGGGDAGGGTGSLRPVTTTRYSITVDQSPLRSLPNSCYASGAPPSVLPPPTRVLSENWDLITGNDGQQFLSVDGETTFTLGDAKPVVLGDILVASNGDFPAQVRINRELPNPAASDPNFSSAATSSAKVDISSTTNGLSGVMHLSSSYVCTSCTNNNGQVNCSADLPFTGVVIPTLPAPDPSTGSAWRLALDMTALSALPPVCYSNSTAPTSEQEFTNRRTELGVQLWRAGDAEYLEAAPVQFALGAAEPVQLDRPIRGSGSTYTGAQKDRVLFDPAAANPGFSSTMVRTVTFTWPLSAGAATGTLKIQSEYACVYCTNNNGKADSCFASLPFVAIRGGRPLTSAPPFAAGQRYRIAINDANVYNLPASCFADGGLPPVTHEFTNLALKGEFTLFKDAGSEALQVLPTDYVLGDAAPVSFATLRGVDAGVFYEEQVSSTATEHDRRALTVMLDEQNSLSTGTVDVQSLYSCTNCVNDNGRVSCTAELPFDAADY